MAMAWSWVRVSCLALLFSGCLAAVVNKETPEALVAHEDIETSTVALKKFTWTPSESTERLPDTYISLEICFGKKLEIVGDEITTLVYNAVDDVVLMELNGDIPVEVEAQQCVTFKKEDESDIPLPPDDTKFNYQLHISGSDGVKQQMGDATFTLDAKKYDKTGSHVACGETSYTRSVVAASSDCEDDGQNFITDGSICYSQETSAVTRPDENGCIEDEEATDDGLLVCLSDKGASDPVPVEGTVVVNSLTYPGENPVTAASLNIAYTGGTVPVTEVEFIMQDTTDNSTLFYAGACAEAAGGSCPTAEYAQDVMTYQVCGVGVYAGAVVSYTSDAPDAVITDLNLAVFQYEDNLQFGFNNFRNKDKMFYFASMANNQSPETELLDVGIDCNGVDEGNICYGFLATTSLITDTELQVKVGFGKEDGAKGILFDSNLIIAHVSASAAVPPPDPPQ